MNIACESYALEGTCGVSLVHGFYEAYDDWDDRVASDDIFGGIGHALAGFVDTPMCRNTYEEIKQAHTIVFQSPVKVNQNSGNRFFFIVFKRKDA